MFKATLCFAAVFSAALLTSGSVFAQGGPFMPPTEAMDTLNESSAGPGAGNYIGRANAAAGVAPGGNPFGAPNAGNPFGANAGSAPFNAAPAPGGNPFGGGVPGEDPFASDDIFADPTAGMGAPAGGSGAAPVQLPAMPEKSRVLAGTRIYDPITARMNGVGRILQDAQWQYVWASDAQENFYDDGSHGDPQPNDQYYSNVVESSDQMAPVFWRMFRQTKQMIRTAEEKDPLRFFQLTAVTTDPDSRLPQYIDKERERDQRILEWNNQFLRVYRIDQDNEQSPFFKPFIPPPPRPPDVPPPAGFTPAKRLSYGETLEAPGANGAPSSFDDFLDTAGGLNPGAPSGAGEPFGGEGVTGEPINPAASSNYFSTTAAPGSRK